MRPDRAIAACLSGLAAGLVALLLFGPTEGAEAKEEAPEARTTAPEPQTPVPEPQTTAETETEPVTTTEAEPVTTTEPEPRLPAFLPGDGTFPEAVTITLAYRSEVESKTQELPRRVSQLRLEARATALRGEPGNFHGIQCSGRRVTYEFLVDPWSDTYALLRTDPVNLASVDLDRGDADDILSSRRPNVLSLACESRRQGTTLSLRANGEPVTAFLDRGSTGRFGAVGLTAWSLEGAHEVVFDGVVVETGRVSE